MWPSQVPSCSRSMKPPRRPREQWCWSSRGRYSSRRSVKPSIVFDGKLLQRAQVDHQVDRRLVAPDVRPAVDAGLDDLQVRARSPVGGLEGGIGHACPTVWLSGSVSGRLSSAAALRGSVASGLDWVAADDLDFFDAAAFFDGRPLRRPPSGPPLALGVVRRRDTLGGDLLRQLAQVRLGGLDRGDLLGRRLRAVRQQHTRLQIEGRGRGQHVQDDAGREDRLGPAGVVRVGGDPAAVEDRHRTTADDLQMRAPYDGRGVLVDTDPEQAGGLGDQRQQPAVPVALGEVLVDDRALDQAEPAGQLAHPLPRGRAGSAERDHVLGQDARAGRRTADRRASRVRLGDGSAERRTGDHTAQLELVAAGHEDAGGVGAAAR